jgi:transposase
MTRMALLSDEMWARVEPLLPPVKGAMGRPMREYRQLVEGAIYRYRTGIAWRDLPAEFGPWQTVWKRHHRFSTDGTSARVHQHGATASRSVTGATSHTGGTTE